MTSRRKVLAAALLAVAVAGGTPAGASTTVRLQAANFRFCAASATTCTPSDAGKVTTVKVGTRVTWTYTDHACDVIVPCPGHNVVFSNGTGNHKLIKKQGAVLWTTVFRRAGRYSYVCTAHSGFGMTGTIVVKR